MSVITPLLDTLLHQVLGRRADIERSSILKPDAPLSAIAKTAPVHDVTANPDSHREELQTSAQAAGKGAGASQASEKAGRAASYYQANTPSSHSQQPSGSTALHLSNEARMIAEVLSRFPASPQAVQARAPLIDANHASIVPLLVVALRQQLASSGIFYESHLAQWYVGQRSLEQLGQEPQMRFPVSAQAASSQATASASPSNVSANVKDLPQPQRSGMEAANTVNSMQTGLDDGLNSIGGNHRYPSHLVSEATLPILRQQLELIGSQTFRWEGMAWPGAPLQWRITDEGGSQDHGDESASSAAGHPWSTVLNLSLPSLGELEIKLTLQGNKVQLQAWSGEEEPVKRLTSAAVELRNRFEAAGLEAAPFQFMIRAPQDDE